MFVKIRFKTKDKKHYKYTDTFTIKEAEEIYNKKLKNDKNIIAVYLMYFTGWHWHIHKILKKEK